MEQWQKDSIEKLSKNLIILSRYGFVYVSTKGEKAAIINHLNLISVDYEVIGKKGWKIQFVN